MRDACPAGHEVNADRSKSGLSLMATPLESGPPYRVEHCDIILRGNVRQNVLDLLENKCSPRHDRRSIPYPPGGLEMCKSEDEPPAFGGSLGPAVACAYSGRGVVDN